MWHSTDGIFLGLGKYVVEILKRFEMMDCKAMATSMASNLELLSDDSLDMIDAMMYRQIICSLMSLMNMRPKTCFVVNNLSQFLMYQRHAQLVEKNTVRCIKGTIEYGLKYDMN